MIAAGLMSSVCRSVWMLAMTVAGTWQQVSPKGTSSDVAFGFDQSLWFVGYNGNTVIKFDPSTSNEIAR
jgi:hypothetical protein